MNNSLFHEQLIKNYDKICPWFTEKSKKFGLPIYSSYDIRDAGFKITNVDANIYPAGFNNICAVDKENAPETFREYIHNHYGTQIKKIMLITEEHTHNAFYWENVRTLKTLLEEANFVVRLAIPKDFADPLKVMSSTQVELEVYSAVESNPHFLEFKPDLIVSNNDFSEEYKGWAEALKIPINPPKGLGWYQRKKSRYFKHYNQLAKEFAELIQIDPWFLTVETEEFEGFDIAQEDSRKHLAARVDLMIENIKKQYIKHGINEEPFVFVKNNSGTYGLAVIKVKSGQDVLEWNYKSRKKMKAAKGGKDVEEVIVQEGIPSVVVAEGSTAEPVIYMVGCELVGGFLRTHQEKDSTESLNSPGAVYKRLCMSDLGVDPKKARLENIYGWSAKLGMLAIALEGAEMNVHFVNYQVKPCGKN